MSDNDFRSFNDDNDIGCNSDVFYLGYQKTLESAEPIKIEFKFSENVPTEIYCFALVLTNNLVSISSDVRRHFDLIQVIFNFFIKLSFSLIVDSVFFNKDSIYISGKLSMR